MRLRHLLASQSARARIIAHGASPSLVVMAVCARAALVTLLAGALLACSDEAPDLGIEAILAPDPPAKNVVLVILDTFRADRMGTSRLGSGITPELDRFADTAVVFEQAYSHAPWTLPSIASIYTGRTPERHGAGGHLGAFRKLSEEATTLAEVFRDAGATTAAIINVIFLTENFGMTQGFDIVDAKATGNNESLRRAGGTTDAALRFMDEHRDRPFLLLVHYFDAHLTYDPPQPYRAQHADPRDAAEKDTLFGSMEEMLAFRRGQLKVDRTLLARLEKLYDGEVAYLDHEVARLLSSIDSLGLERETVIALTADHGEEFVDHGGWEHGHTVFEELIHVPLIVRAPGLALDESGRPVAPIARIPSTVRLMDLAPTLCELAGIPVPASFDGHSLAPLLRGEAEPGRPVLSQGNMWGPSFYAWRRGKFKWIEVPGTQRLLYDIEADPREQMDLSGYRVEEGEALARELALVLERARRDAARGEAPDLDEDQLRELRSLGYLD